MRQLMPHFPKKGKRTRTSSLLDEHLTRDTRDSIERARNILVAMHGRDAEPQTGLGLESFLLHHARHQHADLFLVEQLCGGEGG